MPNNLSKAIAAEVRQRMIEKNVSEQALANETGIPRVTLRRRLAGAPFTTDELFAIAPILGTTPSRLFALVEVAA